MATRYYGIQNEVKSYCNRLQEENGIFPTQSAIKTLNDRVETLKKSGVWSSFGLGFNDQDGDAYLTRAAVTDVIGRSEVLWFTRGMKALGVWSSMVSWPMRSYQNAGTGSTVYSLGGLGIYNGTMINSPTWSLSGVNNMVYNSKYISMTLFSLDPFIPSVSFAAYFRQSNNFSLASNAIDTKGFVHGAGSSGGQGININGRGYIALSLLTPASIWYANTLEMANTQKLAYRSNNGGAITTLGASTYNWSDYSSSDNNFRIQNTGGDATDPIAFMSYFRSSVINSSQKLYTLYKSTLGNGLGLP